MKQFLNFYIIFLLLSLSVSALEYGENYERGCMDDVCTTSIYSYQKYYQDSGAWKQVDEKFANSNCETDYDSCVDQNIYQVHINNAYGGMLLTAEDTKLSFALANLGGLATSQPQATVQDNVVTYGDVFPGVDVKYTYLPRMLKEEIIINDKTIFDAFQNDLDVIFNLESFGTPITENNGVIEIDEFSISNLIAFDSEDNLIDVPFSLSNNQVKMTIPLNWLQDDDTIYPITIDPTFEVGLNSSEDISVKRRHSVPNTYDRASLTGVNLFLGIHKPTALFVSEVWKADSEFDISSIPDNATITNLTLTYFVKSEGVPIKNLEIRRMTGNRTIYPDTNGDDCSNQTTGGNCNFWTDMGNYTLYTSLNLSGLDETYISLDLDSATNDFTNVLSSGLDWISYGLSTNEGGAPSVGDKRGVVRSQNAADANERPRLEITYTQAGVNETDGDEAIEEGMNNALSNHIIHDEQQVYTRSSSGTQELGTFDRFAVNGTQRWAVNYVTTGESFTNMNNITSTFFVLELEDLFFNDIVQRVQDFIEGTLN